MVPAALDVSDVGQRVDGLRTKASVALAFFSQRSPQVISVAVVAAVAVRFVVGADNWGWADLFVVAVTALVVGPVEWVLHTYLLHAGPDSWARRRLGTGIGHQKHHVDPPAIEWLLLGGGDAGLYAFAIGVMTLAWSAVAVTLFGLLVGGQVLLAPMVTAVLFAYLALGHYEWVHLLVHTRCRLRSPYYKRLARNHRRHHYRNEGYWLGITSNLGDRIFRTYPRDTSSIPLSETARTLG